VQDDDFVADAVKDEKEKEAEPVMQKVQDNDRVVGAVKDEGQKEADPAEQNVQDNDFMVDATKHQGKKEADPATQEVQDKDIVVGADPGNTNIITIAAPKRAEDGIDGNLRQKDMRLLRFSRARYYRESVVVNARMIIVTWNAGIKHHLEALSEATSRGAVCEAFRKFMEFRVAHWDALWEEYRKPRWARLRMNLYGVKQRAFANFFNQLSAFEGDDRQRLVEAYGAGRWQNRKGTTPAPATKLYKECARRLVTIPLYEFRTSYTYQELGCTLQRVEMEKCQKSAEEIAKVRTAGGGANGKEGESSRVTRIGEYSSQRHEMYGVREPRFSCRYQYTEMCGAGEKTSRLDTRGFYWTTSQSRTI